MSIKRGNLDRSELSGATNNINLKGLDKFIKSLEKYFFSEIWVKQNQSPKSTEVKLIIEVKRSWKLSQEVQHFRRSTLSDTGYNSKILLNILAELQEVNNVLIDIEELTLSMQDTTIIIQRIGSLSVARQYDNIMRVIVGSYSFIVSQIREVPQEIYIPVFVTTGNKSEKNSVFSQLTNKTSDKDYYSYWGLCYQSEFDSIIYDVANCDFIFEDLMFYQD